MESHHNFDIPVLRDSKKADFDLNFGSSCAKIY